MEVIQMSENTWRMEEDGVRFFLLAGTERALLLDSGMQTRNAKEIAEGLTALPVELLNTHADPDHIAGNGEFASFYLHPAEASNYYNTQKRTGTFVPVEDGQVIDLGGRRLEVILIPGHTPGSIALLDIEARTLYSGDTVQDGTVFLFGVQREPHAYLHSLQKLERESGRFDTIYPSHGTIPVSPALIGQLCEAARSLLAGELTATDAEFHGMALKRYDAGCAAFLCER